MANMILKIKNLINGEWQESSGEQNYLGISSITGEPAYQCTLAQPLDFVRTVQAANGAQAALAKIPWETRSQHLMQLADALTVLGENDDVAHATKIYRHFASLPAAQGAPVGNVAVIPARNFPVSEMAFTIAPAFMVGCPLIIKPSHRAARVPFQFAQLAAEILPKNAVQFLFGDGTTIGQLMAAHPAIDFVSFSGRTEVGQTLARELAGNLKLCTLRLSTKNSAVILDGTDVKEIVPTLAKSCFSAAGQTPWATAKILVAQTLHETLLIELLSYLRTWQFTDDNYLLDTNAKTSLLDKIKLAEHEKGQVITFHASSHPAQLGPTLINDLHNCATIHQEDLFGPVVLINPVKYTHEAIKWANTTPYGFSTLIFGTDIEKCQRTAAQIHSAHAWINNWNPQDQLTAFVGLKQSGFSTARSELLDVRCFLHQTRISK